MARVTVEDCLKNEPNRFKLVLKAAERARDLAIHGKQSAVPEENDKPTVVALREIAEGYDVKKLSRQQKEAAEAFAEIDSIEEALMPEIEAINKQIEAELAEKSEFAEKEKE